MKSCLAPLRTSPCWLFLLLALAPERSLHAEPAGPPVDVTTTVRRMIEKTGQKLGHVNLQLDARLEAAATSIGQYTHDCGPPPRELVEESMWQSGVVEPVHRLMLVRFAPESPQDMLAELPARLPQLLGTRGRSGGSGGRWSRYAFGSVPLASGDRCGVIVVLETFVTIAPMPRAMGLGQSAAFVATMHPSYRKPKALISPPAGTGDVMPLLLTVDEKNASRYGGYFTCVAPGRFALELLADDAAGPAVLAKFPCDCGVATPSLAQLGVGAVATQHAPLNPAIAEPEILRLINEERVKVGRPPLILDERLSAVVRANSEDMHRNQYVAHVSPQTGSPGDRVRRAGIAISRLTENLVKAPDARSSHRELMESPGHRASILDPAVQRVGIGAALTTSPAGEPWLLITELFASLPSPAN